METQTQSESLDVDVLLNDESKLNSLLEHLKNHTDEIAKTVSHLLHKSREKDRVLYEREEEVEEGQDYLTRTLEICLSIIAQTKNAEEYFKELLDSGVIKTNVCGTIWQDGDSAYKCTNCEMDSACAICVDCFNAGNHIGHNFKMIKVAGGVCDCGDFNAWKPSGFCSKHRGISDEEPFSSLPPYLFQSAKQILHEVLIYFNSLLKKISEKNKEEPENESDEDDIDIEFEFNIRDAIEITQWLETLYKKGDAFRRLLAEEWTQVEDNGVSLLDDTMKSHPNLVEEVTDAVHNLFFPLLFVPLFRRRFLQRHFIPYYRDHIENHISTGANEKEMLSDFPVQLFTVNSCTNILMEENMLEILLDKFKKILRTAAVDEQYTKEKVISTDSELITTRVYYRLTLDCSYILSHIDMAHYFLYHNNSQLIQEWCSILRLVQGMDRKTNIRVKEGHAEYDSEEWIAAFLLDLELMQVLPQLCVAANYKEQKFNYTKFPLVLQSILKDLLNWSIEDLGITKEYSKINKKDTTLLKIEYKVSEGANTWHLPLHRYFSGLIHEAIKVWSFKLEDLFSHVENRIQVATVLMEHPLRVQVMTAQIRSDMWNRNGREITAQLESYNSIYFRDTFRDLDVFLLQICSYFMGPSHFLKRTLQRFELYEWLTNKEGLTIDSEGYELKMIEEWIRFIILLSIERTNAGASTEYLIRRAIIHRLAIEDVTHSQLLSNIESELVENSKFESILSEVAVFHEPKQMEQGTYSLKDECWDEWDRYYPHYNRAELEKAEERMNKNRKNKVLNINIPTYSGLQSLCLPLFSTIFYKVLYTIIWSAYSNPGQITETLLNETLFALHLSLTLYNPSDVAHAKDYSDSINNNNNKNNNNVNNNNNTPSKRKISHFSGNMEELDFPTLFNVTANSRHEMMLGNATEEKTESLVSMLRRLPKIQQYGQYNDKINQILKLFSEKDIGVKQYIEVLAGKEKHEQKESKEEDEEDEQEAKKRRRERQAMIMKKFQADMSKFKMEPTTDEESEQEAKESLPFKDVTLNCALCHEEHPISVKPLGFVALVQPNKLLQIAKQLQLRQHQPKVLYLEEELVRPTTPQSQHENEEKEENEDNNGLDFSYIDDSDDDSDDDSIDEINDMSKIQDISGDKISRAHSFMYNLLHDPIADQFQDEDMSDDDEFDGFDDDLLLMSNESPDNENEGNDNENQAENPDEEVEDHDVDQNSDDENESPFIDGEEDDDVIDISEMPEPGYFYNRMAHHFMDMQDEMDEEDISEIDKTYKDIEQTMNTLLSDPNVPDADEKLEIFEDQLDGLDEVLDEFREDNVPQDQLEPLEKKRQELREKLVELVRLVKKPIFDLTKGIFLNMQHCNNHTIHADCLERYLLNLAERYENGENYEGEHQIDLERGEYLCVVCRRLGNSLIPIVPYHTVLDNTLNYNPSLSLKDWINSNFEIMVSGSFIKPNFTLTPQLATVVDKFVQGMSEGKSGIIATETSDEEKVLFAAETLCSTLGNTLGQYELQLRGKGPLLDVTEKSMNINLKCQLLLGLAYRNQKADSQALFYHQKLLYTVIKGKEEKITQIMSLDLFSTFLQLVLIWPKPQSLLVDLYYFSNLFFNATVAQILVNFYLGKNTTENSEKILQIVQSFVKNPKQKFSEEIPKEMINEIKLLCLPFLRCASLLAHSCFEIPPPELTDEELESDEPYDEFTFLCGYLKISKNFPEYLTEVLSHENSMINDWIYDFLKLSEPEKILPVLIKPEPFQLIPLTPLYHDLLLKYNRLRCVNCGKEPSSKAICLICGQLVCAGNNCCRDARGIGECTQHAFHCGAGIGLFLVLKMSSVLVVRDDRHAFWGSPYLDDHGEEDLHLIRGRPLHFNKERYDQLTQLYVSLRLEYDPKIIENTTVGEANWY